MRGELSSAAFSSVYKLFYSSVDFLGGGGRVMYLPFLKERTGSPSTVLSMHSQKKKKKMRIYI